jgi:F-type H+-transporting ATPase subunit gamma
MVAMRNATESASELIDELTLLYNKARQETITTELLDITGGVVALE